MLFPEEGDLRKGSAARSFAQRRCLFPTISLFPTPPGCSIIRPDIAMNEWNIQSRAHACQGCGKPFADKQHYHTLLSDEKAEFHRIDVCPQCWEQQYSHGASDRKGFISHWQGLYEAPPAAAAEAIQKENAESLLRKVIESNDPKYGPAAYILAVMLERKRVLKVKEQLVRDGH